ncbi:hypothetical protein CXG81DRAFT_8398 [Caulochytrium protostelioides]|uniref:RNA polymerase III subunit Rpc25 domain-containing protein n=1 Tax=Caulochytrium protostelioides TaxID=1555241 RepID=A0A4P9XFD4_9FUNG|nr:hypothetical protein CXG81DRAFT_8398 [Caulochytrium protostelioides]|eukprot:RKP04274.1 hypothetical protein CXG81DRAFT_8398 [Caulochytrium protostelioides]
MFQLAQMQCSVRVQPKDWEKTRTQAITDELNKKYANKILHNVGLCIQVFDLLHVTEAVVHLCQDGAYQVTADFRLVVFRAFTGEILTGTVMSASPEDGLRISMGFFDDIYVPLACMKPGCVYDQGEGVYVWKYEGEDLFLDRDEPIRFQVLMDDFVDVGPVAELHLAEGKELPAPYTITASIADDGLGLLSWWDQADEDDEAADEDAGEEEGDEEPL